jgi:Transmembrane family 220, helix
MFRALNAGMALLFLFAAVVQYNDPDPLRWVAIYGAACVASIRAAAGRPFHPAFATGIAAVALIWSLAIMFPGQGGAAYRHMFDAWEMTAANVEEARETVGLLIVAAWMAALAVRRPRRWASS